MLACLGLSGCGTLVTRTMYDAYYQPAPGDLVYSGVKCDLFDRDTKDILGWARFIDLPFSAVADTICLPWDVSPNKGTSK